MKRARLDVDVSWIIAEVRKDGDKALQGLTQKFDSKDFKQISLKVEIDEKTLKIIKQQIRLSKSFAEKQKPKDWTKTENNIMTGEKFLPIESVGIYVPGGKNPFPTVVQTLAIPAQIAGVKRIVMCTPDPRPELIVTAKLCGVTEIYQVGGAQAIAAMAYGTETIKPVLKIVGPGNPYVQAAKMAVFGKVDIDMPAGPSEVLIIADDTANPIHVAYDLLAKAEHGPDSAAVLVTTSETIARQTEIQFNQLADKMPRKEYIKKAWEEYGGIKLVNTMDEAIAFANDYAAEHLQIITRQPFDILPKIENAGSVFLGENNPVATGDYASGVNHIIPTTKYARMFSPVSTRTFMKSMQISYMDKQGLETLKPIVDTIAKLEGLEAHRMSVMIR